MLTVKPNCFKKASAHAAARKMPEDRRGTCRAQGAESPGTQKAEASCATRKMALQQASPAMRALACERIGASLGSDPAAGLMVLSTTHHQIMVYNYLQSLKPKVGFWPLRKIGKSKRASQARGNHHRVSFLTPNRCWEGALYWLSLGNEAAKHLPASNHHLATVCLY